MNNQLDIELVIFNMDGLMFETEKISFEAWKEAPIDITITERRKS